ncbi:hypothetical protein NOCARDAX2BIS_90111 [Nocardioides sp. AX2bis]|nr:hypothetical protein NOCARDAX2BIS_90111 [Nocardioides sp. AX2bis]
MPGVLPRRRVRRGHPGHGPHPQGRPRRRRARAYRLTRAQGRQVAAPHHLVRPHAAAGSCRRRRAASRGAAQGVMLGR